MKNKYKPVQAKAKSKKISFEKKVIIQSCFAILLLFYAIVVCYTNFFPNQKQFLHKTANISSTKNDIKNMIDNSVAFSKNIVSYGNRYFNSFVTLFDQSAEKTETKASAKTKYTLPEKPIEPAPAPQEQVTDTQEQVTEPPKFRYPANGKITSPFGKRIHPITQQETTHYGVDIAANYGDCVISSLPGTVTDAGFDSNLGNYVKVKHSENMETVYGHMSEILVKKDEVVDSNTRIGSAGATGAATGPHVHLEVRIDGQCVDPEIYLPKE